MLDLLCEINRCSLEEITPPNIAVALETGYIIMEN